MGLKDCPFNWAWQHKALVGDTPINSGSNILVWNECGLGRYDSFLFLIKLARGSSSSFTKEEPFCQQVVVHPNQHHEEWTLTLHFNHRCCSKWSNQSSFKFFCRLWSFWQWGQFSITLLSLHPATAFDRLIFYSLSTTLQVI